MAPEPSPAFLFYVKDWHSSRKVQAMSYDERGRYLEMLIEQWETGSLPPSPAAIATLFGDSEAGWARAWPKLSPCFTKRSRDGHLVNPKLEAVRRDRQRYKKSQAESGLRGANSRWEKHRLAMGSPSKPNGVSMAKNGSSTTTTSSSSSFASSSATTPAAATADDDGSSSSAVASKEERRPGKDFLSRFKALYREHLGQPYREQPRDRADVDGLLQVYELPRLVEMTSVMLTHRPADDAWIAKGNRSIAVLKHRAVYLDGVLREAQSAEKATRERTAWDRVLECIETKVQRWHFESWLRPTRLIRSDGATLVVAVDGPEHQAYLERNYSDVLAMALTEAGVGATDVRYEIVRSGRVDGEIETRARNLARRSLAT